MYDFVIIGGGIIGMSTAMQLIDVYPDARIALLEKESGPACHQTGHNSGMDHAAVVASLMAGRAGLFFQQRNAGVRVNLN